MESLNFLNVNHGDAADVLHRLVGHVVQRVLVLLHLLLHARAGHAHQDRKGEHDGHEAQQPQPPVERKQQREQAAGRGDGPGAVGQLVRKVRLRGGAGFVDDLAQTAAPKGLRRAQGQLDDVPHRLDAQVRRDAEGAHVRAHQPGDVDQHRNPRKEHGQPAVAHEALRAGEIRRDGEHLLHDPPDENIGHQRDQGACGGEHPGRIAQVPVSACIAQQALEVGLLFQQDPSLER